ncbi:hypothetical protein ACIRRI_50520 [Streptomyces mirabilis]
MPSVVRPNRSGSDRDNQAINFTVARVDPVHLGERLGLFTTIVLGEGVA